MSGLKGLTNKFVDNEANVLYQFHLQNYEFNHDHDDENEIINIIDFSEAQKDFINQHRSTIRTFGMLKDFNISRQYLEEHPYLIRQDTLKYLTAWSINLQMDDDYIGMECVSRQGIIIRYVLESIEDLKYDPIKCVKIFFHDIPEDAQEYDKFLYKHLQFQKYVDDVAQQKIEDLSPQKKDEKRQKRLGPGGLERIEVMKSLPIELQECIVSRNVEQLQHVLLKMPREEFDHHLDRCIKAGLLIQKAKKAECDGEMETKNDEP